MKNNAELKGDDKTKNYYQSVGWVKEKGKYGDNTNFGQSKPLGVIQTNNQIQHWDKLSKEILTHKGKKVKILDCGCGANPVIINPSICSVVEEYVGIDFSDIALQEANKRIQKETTFSGKKHFQNADMVKIPLTNEEFDYVYSGNSLIHVSNLEAQKASLREMARVTKSNGTITIIYDNQYPLFFPFRLASRILSKYQWIRKIFKKNSPIPYDLMSINEIRSTLSEYGDVTISSWVFPTNIVAKNLNEDNIFSKFVWSFFGFMEHKLPKIAAYTGSIYRITCIKK
ncbi:MAG: class I SAM-dependent methyltransferase [Bdellovibrionales bacterium]|nr:class I SAM-dependent methyltransferase [Bdellovibrionales bacterium]